MVFKRLLRHSANKIKKHTFLYHLPLQVTQARFSQSTIPEDLAVSQHPGTQCCVIAMTALVTSQHIAASDWTSDILDNVIISGDKLHSEWITAIGRSDSKEKRIAVEELPEKCFLRGQCFKIVQGKIHYGTLGMSRQTSEEFKLKTFGEALDYCLSRRFNGALLTIQDKTMAIFYKTDFLYLCDSHGCDSMGKPCRNGQAILAKFVNRDHLVYYIKHRDVSTAMFNVVPLTLTPERIFPCVTSI